ncbi:outer membrane lipoprotein carrier protein LolA [Pseudoflavitalea sp. G-6-1-2]|uniref:LolA family protein n=1 Tax=Pseudoflavitalea sp. G-6-1-2 TaxID=2728841 RepID=UPI00146D9723|nr:outer membrane lipoprotein carrier protein LolA [Pseudoflavitalea sp. G-6-1-2]NML23201.1 outer membrane lipoprotein carrier protein LolA [Pseudoflavitalea sp. G-6-1-2]
MKKISLFFAIVIASFSTFAQGNDPAAKKILDAVSAKFKSFKGVQANFTLKNEDEKGKVLGTKKGTVAMKGNKYKVNITGQEIFCDGVTVWTYDKSANEVTITKADNGASTLTPQKLFTNFYDKDFLYKLNGEKKEAGKTVQEIEMTPVDKTKLFHKVYLQVDKATSTLYSTKVLDKNQNRFTYTVNSMNGKVALADASFTFDKKKYPGVEEIDLR